MIGESFYLLIEMYIAIFSWYAFLRASYTIKQARFHILLRLQIFFDLYTECSLRLIPYAFLRVDRLEEMLLLMSENTDPLYNALFLHKVGGAENLQWVKQVYALRNVVWCVIQTARPGADVFGATGGQSICTDGKRLLEQDDIEQ